MSVREMVQISLLLALGTVLHIIIPGYGQGMKPDLILGMLFIIIIMYPRFKPVLLAGIVAGILAALTTSFPGGQLPNIIDRVITSLVVLGMVTALKDRIPNIALYIIVGLIGTAVSGAVFLTSALILAGLPAAFNILYTTVVIPAMIMNTILMIILFPLVLVSRNLAQGNVPKPPTA